LLAIVRGAIEGVSARQAIARAITDPQLTSSLDHPLHVVAVGKAAAAMVAAIVSQPHLSFKAIVGIGTHRTPDLPPHVEWHEAAHPFPDQRSVSAARRVFEVATAVKQDECLLLLLSGGASALMALPIEGLAITDKQAAIRTMMLAGADIAALNTVRKHLSAIKGGRLAAACRGATLTLAISDVVGDDLSVIGSGPGVADPTTWQDVADVVQRFGEHSAAIHALVAAGLRGDVPETPKPGDATLARTRAIVIASRRHALDAARNVAERLGYHVPPSVGEVTGEARTAAPAWFARALAAVRASDAPACMLSAGETTVRVVGRGRGGRNQEFVLALTAAVASAGGDIMVASVGTDGIDGPTDAAGALVDPTTRSRAAAIGLDPDATLADNNAYEFFAMLGDLIHLGRTDTNVGDVQVLLRGERPL
jgi:hydroxypyruvate reductase